MKRSLFFSIILFSLASHAQIGYQVSLLNSATGEPRANETVTCTITLTNAEGTVICSETKSAVSNDFGVLSLSVGNAGTFDNVDWSKQPFFVSASVDGNLIGKSQVLTVPVAEHANHYGTLTYENIHEKKVVGYSEHGSGYSYSQQWKFNGRTATLRYEDYDEHGYQSSEPSTGIVRIDGNTISGYIEYHDGNDVVRWTYSGHYFPEDDTIYIGYFED